MPYYQVDWCNDNTLGLSLNMDDCNGSWYFLAESAVEARAYAERCPGITSVVRSFEVPADNGNITHEGGKHVSDIRWRRWKR